MSEKTQQQKNTCNLPSDLDGVELHAHRKYSAVLAVLGLCVRAHHGAEVVVLHPRVVFHDEVAPSLLPRLALHLILDNRSCRVPLGEILLEVFVDLVVDLGEAELGAGDLLEDVPVRLHVLHHCRILLAIVSA